VGPFSSHTNTDKVVADVAAGVDLIAKGGA
jgi:hypothetical protein